eukprot:g6422.t1
MVKRYVSFFFLLYSVNTVTSSTHNCPAGHVLKACQATVLSEQAALFSVGSAAIGDYFGRSISISNDASIIAIGSRGGESDVGYTRVVEWNACSQTWIKRGSDISGQSTGDQSGYSVSLSGDGSILAVGEPGYQSSNGRVRLWKWGNGSWGEYGEFKDTDTVTSLFGLSVSLSNNGTVLAIAIPIASNKNFQNIGETEGLIRVFEWNGNQWTRKGQDLRANVVLDFIDDFMSLSANGSIISTGIFQSNNKDGYIRVWEWNSNHEKWAVKGSDIHGSSGEKFLGKSISLSFSGSVLAAVSENVEENSSASKTGHVRVFEYRDAAWVQRGDIINFALQRNSIARQSVHLNSDGRVLAIGGHGTSLVFEWVMKIWTPDLKAGGFSLLS